MFIQRGEHRDTQAIHANLDELLKTQPDASHRLARIDEEELGLKISWVIFKMASKSASAGARASPFVKRASTSASRVRYLVANAP